MTTPQHPAALPFDRVASASAIAASPDEVMLIADARRRAPVLDVMIPVYNEETDLARSIERLSKHLAERFPYSARITVVDNASTDGTLEVARAAAANHESVRVYRLDAKGRGRALKAAWARSDAEIVAYMDVDLSTDLNALMPLIAPLISGHSDVAIGTRLARSSRVERGAKREIISRSYNFILHTAMRSRFSDAQCGFKAVRTEVARELLPLIEDTGWFFDTELLVLAERVGLRIAEVPVDWIDDPNSSVDIARTALADLRGCWRVGRAFARREIPIEELRMTLGVRSAPMISGVPHGLAGQLLRFCAIGLLSTAAYAVLYVLLHPVIGAQPANFAALLITAVGNTAANRAITFGVRGRTAMARHHSMGIAVFLLGWALTAAALAGLHLGWPAAGRGVELAVLIAANLITTLSRFILLRLVFRAQSAESAQADLRAGAGDE